jgi:hypothetical protein
MVCIMVRGTLGAIEILSQKVQQDIPAVILKGTGSAADVIAFASDEIVARSVFCWFLSMSYLYVCSFQK